MKKTILLITSIILILAGCSSKLDDDNKINIAVSIGPQEAFVKAVLGDKGTVTTVIPSGFSPANYQPSPKELELISDADIYFSIGVAAEDNILPRVVSTETDIISLKDASEKEYPTLYLDAHSHNHDDDEHLADEKHDEHNHDSEDIEHQEHNHDSQDKEHHEHEDIDEHHQVKDPHIWMSPKRVMVMINTIKDSLSAIDPDNQDYYLANAENYITKLEELDSYIKTSLENSDLENFIIYHPSLGYFADDYNLTMMVIEEDGKAATITTMTNVINFAKDNDIKVVFYQQEFDSKQATVIADEINGKVISLDILSKDYIDNYKKIVDTFVSSH